MIMAVQPTRDGDHRYISYWFWCPGCEGSHRIDDTWGWNGNTEKPTFTPSVLVQYPHPTGYSNDHPAPKDYNGPITTDICHSFVTDGQIRFLEDSTHALAGKTVPLPELPDWLAR